MNLVSFKIVVRFDLYWKYHNFERNEICATDFLKWTDLTMIFFWSCRKIQPKTSTLNFSTIKSWTMKLLFNDVAVCFLGLKFEGWSLGLKIWGSNELQPCQDNKPISHQIMLILVVALIAFQELKFLIPKLSLPSLSNKVFKFSKI